MDDLLAGDSAELVRVRPPAEYTTSEQQFSSFIQDRMVRLLRGDENELILMRRYCGSVHEVSFFMPGHIGRSDIRPRIAEGIVSGVLRFLSPLSPGGPVAQQNDDGLVRETQTFPTHYPHIVVERLDVFPSRPGSCPYIEWRAVRIQNQRKSTLINRALDLTNILIEVVKAVRP